MAGITVAKDPRNGVPGDAPAEAHPVNDAGVVILITVDDVLKSGFLTEIVRQQAGKECFISGEAGAVKNRRLTAHKFGDAPLEFEVDRLCAADEADGGHPESPLIERLPRRLLDRRVIGEAEIVVRGKHDLVSTTNLNPSSLLALEGNFVLVDLLRLELV